MSNTAFVPPFTADALIVINGTRRQNDELNNTINFSFCTYIPGNHAAIVNDFGEDIKVKWYMASIAFRRIHHDEVIISAKMFNATKFFFYGAIVTTTPHSHEMTTFHLQSVPKLINCLQNWMRIHQHLIQTICGQLKAAFPRNGSFDYGHWKIKHFGHHMLHTQTFSIRRKSAQGRKTDVIMITLLHEVDRMENTFSNNLILPHQRFEQVTFQCGTKILLQIHQKHCNENGLGFLNFMLRIEEIIDEHHFRLHVRP